MKLKCCLWLKPIVLLFLISGSVFAQADPQITEFMASNRAALADEDGDFPDWIEIYNPSTTAINLDGWYLTDSDNQLNKWRFPAVTVPSKNFLIVFASGKNRAIAGAELHTSFTLRAEGEYLALVKPDGVAIASQFSPGYPEQFEDISYGIGQNVQTNVLVTAGASARILVPSSGALGVSWTAPGFGDSTWLVGKTGIGYETAVPGFAVRNFKANITVSSLTDAESVITNPARQSSVAGENSNVINYYGSGGDGHYGDNAPFPGAVVGADIDDFVIEATATITIPTAGEWTFGVNSDDGFSLTIGSFTMSYPNPRGPADTLDVFNFPTAGEYNLRLVFYERGGGSCVELFAARGNVPGWNSTNFRLVGDTANGGLAVQAPVISGNSASSYRPLIATDLQSQMKGRNASAYLRIPFVVANAGSLESLLLRVKYDDGFVAYLNGQEVARRNAPTAPSWNATATASHPNTEAMVFEEINISDKLGAILTGSNVLAIHGLNQSNNDTDFLILPELVEKKVQPASLHYFSTATPGAFNGSGFFAFVEDTKFSHDRGFYDAPFDLTITTATTNAVIRYTTNGLPPTATTGFVYSGPIRISGTTVLRAAAFREGFEPSNVDTQTYLFLEDVIRQSPTGQAPPGWPSSWGANVVDYGMDPDVVNNPLYSGTIKSDLKSIPTFSIVMNLDDLFNSQTGIYANPGQEGRSAERSASVELIHPDGVDGFQIDAGIRIRGGFSRSTGNPKHAFRLFFRQEYGAPKLRYPLFGDAGTDTFDAFDLRTFQNYSWSFQGDSRGVFIRDQFSRDAQLAMGQQGERGNYYHLYINGQYWGLFNTCERPEASYGETYFGGQKENFDVIKVEAGPYSLNATDGDMAAWTRLYNLVKAGVSTDEAYYKIQGRNADGSPNPAYENLLDVENLIDYMLVILYGGNLDAPISNFLQNQRPNNWYGMRDRTGASGGFKFFAHDAEHTLLNVNEDRTGPYPAGDSSVIYSSPQWIWQKLQANAEFRLKVADHVHRHLFNNGVLTPQGARALFMARKDQIDRAVVGESARWGDAKTASPLTRSHWLSAVGSITNGFLPQRTGVLLNQLRADNLYPAVAAPTFSQHGGNVNKGYNLSISAPAGTVYYTLDGSDPRRLGGAVSGAAQIYRTPLAVNESVQINARVLSGGVWSALNQATFTVIQTFTNLLITEIMYNPAPAAGIDGDEYEFIELKNTSNEVLDLSGVHFSNGFSFTFPLGTRASPGQFIVLASNPIEFAKRYPTVRIDGTYTGRLANGGERIQLAHAIGTPIFNVSYSDEAPWPQAADGNGFSIVPVNPNLNPDPANPVHWRASAAIGGSPGRDDISANTGIVWINEVLTHTDPPQIDAIELFNPTTSTVDISHWYLTDSRLNPKKYRIPATTRLGPGEFKVFTEVDFNPTPGVDPSFTLSSHGEEVYIFSANQAGDLTGFSDGFSFGAAANGVSFGRYSTAGGDVQYPAQWALTLGGPNSGPAVGPVVINEIHYQPAPGEEEFIELKNISNATVKLFHPDHPENTWKLDGVGFDFPRSFEIPAGGLAVLVGSDPSLFRSRYSIPTSVPVLGPWPGVLQNSGELLQLMRPDSPDVDTNGIVIVPLITVDAVRYNDRLPWPTNAAGLGASLERLNASAYGNDPVNWRSSPGVPSPGFDNTGNRVPRVNAGPDLNLQAAIYPFATTITGSATDDGQPNPPGQLSVTWTQVSGPGVVAFDNANQFSTTASFPGVGRYVLRLTASDGELEAADEVAVMIERVPASAAVISSGSTWKYLDNGVDQGTAWRERTFLDGSWDSGAAELGYGDAPEGRPENTEISFGPSGSNKYLTYYFRKTFSILNASAVRELTVRLMRDDGAVVYLNGTEVFRSNMPEGNITFSTRASSAIGGADEAAFYERQVDPSLLVNGNNVVAVEVHQSGPTSSDLSFDLELIALTDPANQAPMVNAGPDFSVLLPASGSLNGSVLDDGLPEPPGLVSLTWNKVTGPGSVAFANPNAAKTIVSFGGPGTYTLRLMASDGVLSTQDDVNVTVTGTLEPLRITSVVVDAGQTRLRFNAVAGQTYSLLYSENLVWGNWTRVKDIQASSTGEIEVVDTSVNSATARFYRIVTPQMP